MYLVGPGAGVAAWALLMRYVRPGERVHDQTRAWRLTMCRTTVALGRGLLPAVQRMADAMRELTETMRELAR